MSEPIMARHFGPQPARVQGPRPAVGSLEHEAPAGQPVGRCDIDMEIEHRPVQGINGEFPTREGLCRRPRRDRVATGVIQVARLRDK